MKTLFVADMMRRDILIVGSSLCTCLLPSGSGLPPFSLFFIICYLFLHLVVPSPSGAIAEVFRFYDFTLRRMLPFERSSCLIFDKLCVLFKGGFKDPLRQ